jgi:uncharacterized membrane protein
MTTISETPSSRLGYVRGALVVMLGMAWLATGCALSTRIQMVFEYSTLPTVTPSLEVLAVSPGMFWLLAVASVAWTAYACAAFPSNRGRERKGWWLGVVAIGVACLPLMLLAARAMALPTPAVNVGEPLWFAIWTGASLCWLIGGPPNVLAGAASVRSGRAHAQPIPKDRTRLVGRASGEVVSAASTTYAGWLSAAWLSAGKHFGAVKCLWVAIVACAIWWYWQSLQFWLQFQLGFNDFAHFAQRIINTSRGLGVLMETPVLPRFWDHFNPGLVLLVPLWWVYPSPAMFFWLQAICLAGSSGILYAVGRVRGLSEWTSFWIAAGWLLLPSIGQMNVAYTYGWHPITCAIPCLLLSYLSLSRGRGWASLGWAVLAASFEEGVLVAIGCFAAMMWLRHGASHLVARVRADGDPESAKHTKQPRTATWQSDWPWGDRGLRWLVVFLVSLATFLTVYRWSGLAEFQTGRFARLGDGPMEIVLSPLLRPSVFFELLFRPRNAIFLGLLLGPMVLFASRAMAWSLVSVSLPLLVLLLWEHMPAQSLAFQYPSVLLPLLMVGAIESCRGALMASPHGTGMSSVAARAVGFAATCWVLGIFVGQMPWSLDSLLDVQSKTYGVKGDERRRLGGEDQHWLRSMMVRFSTRGTLGDGDATRLFSEQRVLATGRIAAHCLGARDIETVGQFWQRYESLRNLDKSLPSPVLRYDWIILDDRETFQQTSDETMRLRSEAMQYGFQPVQSKHGVEFLLAPESRVATSAP